MIGDIKNHRRNRESTDNPVFFSFSNELTSKNIVTKPTALNSITFSTEIYTFLKEEDTSKTTSETTSQKSFSTEATKPSNFQTFNKELELKTKNVLITSENIEPNLISITENKSQNIIPSSFTDVSTQTMGTADTITFMTVEQNMISIKNPESTRNLKTHASSSRQIYNTIQSIEAKTTKIHNIAQNSIPGSIIMGPTTIQWINSLNSTLFTLWDSVMSKRISSNKNFYYSFGLSRDKKMVKFAHSQNNLRKI